MYPLMFRYGLTPAAAVKAAQTIAQQGTRGKMFVYKTYMAMRQRMMSDYGIRILRQVVQGVL
jgi:hypothetical protein